MIDPYYEELRRMMLAGQIPPPQPTPGNPRPPLRGAGNMPTTEALPWPDTGPVNPPPMTGPMSGPTMPQLPPQGGSPQAAAIRAESAPPPPEALEEIQVTAQRIQPERADPRAKSIAGQERAINAQRAYAQSLRGGKAPQGRSVGPYDVYMGPNWGESLAFAGQQALGGYLSNKANKADEALDEERALIKAAELADADAKDERDYNLRLRGVESADERFKYTKKRDALSDRLNEEKLKYERGLAEAATEAEKAALLEDKRRWEAEHALELEELALEQEKLGTYDGLFDERTNAAINRLGSATERTKAREDLLVMENFNDDWLANAEQMIKDGKSWSGPKVDSAIGVAGAFGQTAQNMATEGVLDEDEMRVRSELSNFVEQFKRNRTGANLTEMEQKLGSDWNPSAPGISSTEQLNRARRLREYMVNSLRVKNIPVPRVQGVEVDTETVETNTPTTRSGRGQGATANQPKAFTEEDIDNMTLEELRENGLI